MLPLHELLFIRDKLLDVFIAESNKRHTKTTEEWILSERAALYNAVNTERSVLGKPPITLKEVLNIENGALGHIDYAKKYALRCAELVLSD